MNSHARMIVAACLAIGAAGGTAQAGELTGRQIAERAEKNNAMGLSDAYAKVKMTLTGKTGTQRVRAIESKSKKVTVEGQEITKSIIRFLQPPDVAGTGFLNIDTKGGETEQHLYLPALKKTRRISSSQKAERFMGTDFTYQDMQQRNLDEFDYKRLPDEKVDPFDCWVVESAPKPGTKDYPYTKTIAYVAQKIDLPVKVRFFDKTGAEAKLLLVEKVEKKQNRWVAMRSLMKTLAESTQTVLEIEDINFDSGFADDVFSVRNLEKL